MSSWELQDGQNVVVRRQNTAPCPNGNGTTIGTAQEFTVLCNTRLAGDVLDRFEASDLTACVDLCSSHHPKCEGASFDGSNCILYAGLEPSKQRFSSRSDSAIAVFPGASSNCPTLGGAQQVLGVSFATKCGFIIDGNDISQNFAPTFQDCLGQCAATSGCAAISFDPSQDLGFKNCYLKTAVTNSSAVAADRRTDSAMLAMAVAPAPPDNPAPAPSAEPSPAVSPTADPAATSELEQSPTIPGVSTIPVPSSAPAAGGGGAVFFTPPAGTSSSVAAVPSPPATSSNVPTLNPLLSTIPDLVTTSSSSLSMPLISTPFPFSSLSPSPSGTPISSAEAVPGAEAGQTTDAGPSSMAWVAAPVVGGVAAISLITVSFVLLRRRRHRNGAGTESGTGTKAECERGSSGSPGFAGLFTSCLPTAWSSSSWRQSTASRARGRTMTGIGNSPEVAPGRRSVAVTGVTVRNSVVAFMTGRPMGMERLEDVEEGEGGKGKGKGQGQEEEKAGRGSAVSEAKKGRMAELRASLNGLGQNKWSQSSE
ncbi:hypothetical protein VTG60DRAFT_2027 [Thermothelomyces hinnuleus]